MVAGQRPSMELLYDLFVSVSGDLAYFPIFLENNNFCWDDIFFHVTSANPRFVLLLDDDCTLCDFVRKWQ